MSKVWLFVLLILLFNLLSPRSTFAATCTFTLDPPEPSQDMSQLIVHLQTRDLVPAEYNVTLEGIEGTDSRALYSKSGLQLSDGRLTASYDKPAVTDWFVGKYKIYLWGQGRGPNDPFCQHTFVLKASAGQSCTASIVTKPIEPDRDVILSVRGLKPGNYDIFIDGKLKSTNDLPSDTDINLGKFEVNNYKVEVKNSCGILGRDCAITPQRLQCNSVAFSVAPLGSGGGRPIDPEKVLKDICKEDPTNKTCAKAGGIACNPETGAEEAGGQGILTAVGCVPTKPQPLVEGLIKFITFGSGGIALLLMIFASFRYITSAGNPDSIKAAWDQFQNAFIGLLFILFSVLLLQIIGVDILGIPGLTG